MARHSTRRLLSVATILGVGVAIAMPAQAQINEIVVTAQKRSEAAQDIPLAISAFDEELLTATGFDGFEDLPSLSPGLQLGNFGPVTFVNLRGIGNENTTAGGDPGVALHYDGVYLGRPVAFLFSAFDSERVEILRGPQGTLYGRNATGGSINYITKKPTYTLSGEADVTVGNYEWVRTRAAINIPLSENIATRIVGFYEQRDGFTDNPAGPDPNDADNWGIRGHLLFDISSSTSLLLSANYVKSGGAGSKPELRNPLPGTATNPPTNLAGPPGFAFSGGPPSGIPGFNNYGEFGPAPINDLRPFNESNDVELESDLEFLLLSATLEHDLGPVSFKSITGFGKSDYLSRQDQDHSILPLAELLITESAEQFSQELQLLSNNGGPLQWIVGAYYFEEDASRQSQFFQGRFDVFADVFDQPAGWNIDGDVNSRAYAAFAQTTYEVTERLALTGGVRYSDDRKEGENRGFIFAGAPYVGDVFGSWDEVTYRFVADYEATDDILLYGSFSTGYRSGGINQAVNPNNESAVYEPETVNAYELGMKTSLFNRRAQFNVALYQNEYAELQFQVFGATGPAAFNAEGAKVRGVEVELLAQPIDRLTINASGSFTDSKFNEQLVAGVQLGGNQVQRTPEWTFNIGATQEFELGDQGVLRLRGDFAYTDSMFYTAFNRRAGFGAPGGSDFAPSYENVNLRFFWERRDGLEFELAVTNLFDTAQVGNLFRGIGFTDIPGGGGEENVTYNPPRQFSLRAGYNF